MSLWPRHRRAAAANLPVRSVHSGVLAAATQQAPTKTRKNDHKSDNDDNHNHERTSNESVWIMERACLPKKLEFKVNPGLFLMCLVNASFGKSALLVHKPQAQAILRPTGTDRSGGGPAMAILLEVCNWKAFQLCRPCSPWQFARGMAAPCLHS